MSVSAGGTISNNTYTWYALDKGGHITITGDSVFYPSENGKYYVKVTNAIATKLILKSDTADYMQSVFSGLNASDNVITAKRPAIFRAYPNPAQDILHIQTSEAASFSIINQQGQIIITQKINGKGTINISKFQQGIYYLKNSTSGIVEKIIVTN